MYASYLHVPVSSMPAGLSTMTDAYRDRNLFRGREELDPWI